MIAKQTVFLLLVLLLVVSCAKEENFRNGALPYAESSFVVQLDHDGNSRSYMNLCPETTEVEELLDDLRVWYDRITPGSTPDDIILFRMGEGKFTDSDVYHIASSGSSEVCDKITGELLWPLRYYPEKGLIWSLSFGEVYGESAPDNVLYSISKGKIVDRTNSPFNLLPVPGKGPSPAFGANRAFFASLFGRRVNKCVSVYQFQPFEELLTIELDAAEELVDYSLDSALDLHIFTKASGHLLITRIVSPTPKPAQAEEPLQVTRREIDLRNLLGHGGEPHSVIQKNGHLLVSFYKPDSIYELDVTDPDHPLLLQKYGVPGLFRLESCQDDRYLFGTTRDGKFLLWKNNVPGLVEIEGINEKMRNQALGAAH